MPVLERFPVGAGNDGSWVSWNGGVPVFRNAADQHAEHLALRECVSQLGSGVYVTDHKTGSLRYGRMRRIAERIREPMERLLADEIFWEMMYQSVMLFSLYSRQTSCSPHDAHFGLRAVQT